MEAYYGTPLPTAGSGSTDDGVRVLLDASELRQQAAAAQKQPQTSQIANYNAVRNDNLSNLNGTCVDVNQHFIVYAVKNGLIRVLHRSSTAKALLRGHTGQVVTDIRFFQDGDVLATVGSTGPETAAARSCVVIWRIFDRTLEIMSEKLLEVSTDQFAIHGVLWHPFNCNQFWMLHNNSSNGAVASSDNNDEVLATLVETTRINSEQHATENYAVAVWHKEAACALIDGAIQIAPNSCDASSSSSCAIQNTGRTGSLTDLAWNGRDTRHVLTVHSTADICLWDLQTLVSNNSGGGGDSATVSPTCLMRFQDTDAVGPLTRCLFLEHDRVVGATTAGSSENALTPCFLTASEKNSSFTLWSPFGAPRDDTPTRLQVVQLCQPSSTSSFAGYVLDYVAGPEIPGDSPPPASFLLLADRAEGNLLAFHLNTAWDSPPGSKKKRILMGGCDYVVPFETKYPVYTWAVRCAPADDPSSSSGALLDDDDADAANGARQAGFVFDMKLFSYQSSVVQCLTLKSSMCFVPKEYVNKKEAVVAGRGGVIRFDGLGGEGPPSLSPDTAAELSDEEGTQEIEAYDSEYDVEEVTDEDDDDDVFEEAPEASALPNPGGIAMAPEAVTAAAAAKPLANNPFANWLGGFTAQTSSNDNTGAAAEAAVAAPSPPLPPSQMPLPNLPAHNPKPPSPKVPTILQRPPSPPPPPPPGMAFLSPKDFLEDKKTPTPASEGAAPANNNNNNKQKKKQRKTTPKREHKNGGAGAAKGSQQQPAPPQQQKISILRHEKNDAPSADTNAVAPAAAAEEVTSTKDGQTSTTSTTASSAAIRKAIREEMPASVIPALKETIQESLDASVQSSLKKFGAAKGGNNTVDTDKIASAVSDGTEERFDLAFAGSMKNVLIPALEALTQQVLSKVSANLEQRDMEEAAQRRQAEQARSGTEALQQQELQAISKQLSTMTSLVASLTDEVKTLRETVYSQKDSMEAAAAAAAATAAVVATASAHGSVTPPPVSVAVPPADPKVAMQNKILSLLKERKFEQAFTSAVSSSTVDVTLFCCKQTQIKDVLDDNATTVLSQPILLCLMQQLSTILVSDKDYSNLQVAFEWLQEIALSINPSDSSIQRHLPGVLKQLSSNINTRMAQGDESLRRPLQRLLQVIRGLG